MQSIGWPERNSHPLPSDRVWLHCTTVLTAGPALHGWTWWYFDTSRDSNFGGRKGRSVRVCLHDGDGDGVLLLLSNVIQSVSSTDIRYYAWIYHGPAGPVRVRRSRYWDASRAALEMSTRGPELDGTSASQSARVTSLRADDEVPSRYQRR